MAKITKNPNLDKIGRFAFHWMWHTEKGPDTYNGQYADAIDGCEENRKKRGVPDGGKCMLIDYRYGDQFKILLQPKIVKKNKIVKKTENNSKESVSQSKKTLPRSYLKTATPDTFLNLEEVDDLTKSVAKYDNSMMSQAEYLFGSNKNYYDSDLQRVSQKKISDIYVTGKRTLDKNPYKTIIGMAYFEFFYAGQVKKNIQKINKFKDTYPNIKSNKAVKDLYNLNEVRKKMRESIGFSLESESADVLRSYITLSKYLKNSTAKKIKLSSFDKKIISYSQNFNKFLSVYEKNIKLRQYNRISEKKFYRELNRSYKKLSTFDKKKLIS